MINNLLSSVQLISLLAILLTTRTTPVNLYSERRLLIAFFFFFFKLMAICRVELQLRSVQFHRPGIFRGFYWATRDRW